MNRVITSLASFHAREGAGEALGLRLCELLLRAQRDAACLGCELQRDPQQEARWLLRGHWRSEADLQAHLQLPHMQLLGRLVENGLIRHMELQVQTYSLGLAS